jgi:hypothetical protein
MSKSSLELDDNDQAEILRLARFYLNEAKRCEKAKAYLAGCVMLGAALEASLILMVGMYPEEVNPNIAPKYRNIVKPLLKWDLAELLRVAKDAGWLPTGLDPEKDEWNRRLAKVGDYGEVVRQIRNLAHPGRYTQDHHRKRITNKHLQLAFETFLASRDWILERVYKSLGEAMEREESDSKAQTIAK